MTNIKSVLFGYSDVCSSYFLFIFPKYDFLSTKNVKNPKNAKQYPEYKKGFGKQPKMQGA